MEFTKRPHNPPKKLIFFFLLALFFLTILDPSEVEYKGFPWRVENYEGFISFSVSHNERLTQDCSQQQFYVVVEGAEVSYGITAFISDLSTTQIEFGR